MSETLSTTERITGYIRAGYSCIWLRTAEESRAERILLESAKIISALPGSDPMPLCLWSLTKGWHGQVNGLAGQASFATDQDGAPTVALDLVNPLDEQGQAKKSPCIRPGAMVVLKDFHAFLNSPLVTRKLRDTIGIVKELGTFVVFLSPVCGPADRPSMSAELEKDVLVMDLPLPEAGELTLILTDLVEKNPKLATQGAGLFGVPRESVVEGLAGLSVIEAENVLSLGAVKHGTFNRDALKTIHREKAQSLRKSGLLRYKESDKTLTDLGGLERLKGWFAERMVAFSPEARAAGIPIPKGVLMVGVQGCGKSAAAEAVANLFNAPLIEGSIGDAMGSLVGESERRIKEMVDTADAIGKCVLRLDEFEKMASGMESSGRTDGGTTSRVMKEFLTWLNDRKSQVFVVATVNRIDALPAEILRKGRFDEIFFVDLPHRAERVEIFTIYLTRAGLDGQGIDVAELAAAAAGFSGAEIEQVVAGAKLRQFVRKATVGTADLLGILAETKPLSVTMRDQIEGVRVRLKDVAVPASLPEPEAEPVQVTGKGRKLKA